MDLFTLLLIWESKKKFKQNSARSSVKEYLFTYRQNQPYPGLLYRAIWKTFCFLFSLMDENLGKITFFLSKALWPRYIRAEIFDLKKNVWRILLLQIFQHTIENFIYRTVLIKIDISIFSRLFITFQFKKHIQGFFDTYLSKARDGAARI